MSENLHALCCAHDVPICMVRGLGDVLDMDLELFSSNSLVETCGDQEIEVRIQVSLIVCATCKVWMKYCIR